MVNLQARKFSCIITSIICLLSCGCRQQLVCIKSSCVRAEIADSPASRQKGLMFRDSLAEDGAMLFIFEDAGRHTFYMKNMRFPLDIIWIGADQKVADIKTDVVPCSASDCPVLSADKPAKYVLEVNAGFTGRNKIKAGDEVVFRPQP